MARATSLASLLLVAAAVPARAEPLIATAYLEGTRFDLETGSALFPGADPSAFQMAASPIRLRAARDEVVAFEWVVRGSPGRYPIEIPNVESRHPAPAGEAGGPVPRFSVFQAFAVNVRAPSESPHVHSLGAHAYPDPLVPASQVVVPDAPGVAILWFDVFVPRATAPGLYRTRIQLSDTTADVEVEVLDVTLPEEDVAGLGAVNFGSLLAADAKSPGAARAWMRLAHAHGLSIELMRPTPKVAEDGSIDWNEWAERVGPYVDGTAFDGNDFGPRASLPTTRFVIPLTDWWPDSDPQGYLPRDPERWSRTLADWERFVSARGWLTLLHATTWILFVNSLDEPKKPAQIEALAAYAPLIAAAQLERRDRVVFRVDGNFGQRIEGYDDARMAEVLGPVVDLWNVHGAPWTIPWDLIQTRRAQGERLMFYASNSGGEPSIPPLVVDAPIGGARAWGWIVYRYGLAGALNWEVDGCAGPALAHPRCSPGGTMNLDANLIFHGAELGLADDPPIASMRLKLLRRGAQDAALLRLVEGRDPALARRLAEVIVPRALGDHVPATGRGAWATDARTYAAAREMMLDRLTDHSIGAPEDIRVDPTPGWLSPRWPWGVLAGWIALWAAVIWVRRARRRNRGSA